ncbi:hypothetical protein A1Q2_02080 [Trichosporon asahii var. asahii CBS 8904]|uniref:Uncharacterized protein n=1 Tax=Trichosporon asahii var. asahii (strain CBS 8904) TaxID=1220162 RepID=K1W3Z2_TRIAC|nr:hypothetical protein A1Q2_02080 [Trichosporon asahii var. asahii CBS 8904]
MPGVGREGFFGLRVAPPIPDEWDGSQCMTARLQWWIEYWQLYSLDLDQGQARSRWRPKKRVQLLTVAEWRAKVGATYFELMTDPNAVYCSSQRLPPFSDLVANHKDHLAERRLLTREIES